MFGRLVTPPTSVGFRLALFCASRVVLAVNLPPCLRETRVHRRYGFNDTGHHVLLERTRI